MLASDTMTGNFLWRVDDEAIFSYGPQDALCFFHIPAEQWEQMGKPATITIMVAAA